MDVTMTQTRREIMEQPQVIARVIDHNWGVAQQCAEAIRKADVSYVIIAGRGTSENAGTYAQYVLGAHNGLPVAFAAPSLKTYYDSPPRVDHALVIGVSQSGASTDIVEVLTEAKGQGALTLAITNSEDSDLANTAELVMPCLAGTELAVAATKTYTSELANFAILSVALEGSDERYAELGGIPAAMGETLMMQNEIAEAVERYRYMDQCVMLSRGYNFATAQEIALKTKELAYVHTQPYSSAEFMHGPLASLYEGFPLFAILASGAVYPSLLQALRTALERQAELIVLSDSDEALRLGRRSFRMPRVPEWLSPIVAVVPGQWFALSLALTKGYDPDRPRALHKVTLTR